MLWCVYLLHVFYIYSTHLNCSLYIMVICRRLTKVCVCVCVCACVRACVRACVCMWKPHRKGLCIMDKSVSFVKQLTIRQRWKKSKIETFDLDENGNLYIQNEWYSFPLKHMALQPLAADETDMLSDNIPLCWCWHEHAVTEPVPQRKVQYLNVLLLVCYIVDKSVRFVKEFTIRWRKVCGTLCHRKAQMCHLLWM